MSRPALPVSAWRGLVLRSLFRTTIRRGRFPYRLYWPTLYQRTRRWTQPVETIIHGQRVIHNANYSYPITSRMYPMFNAPLLELVSESYRALARPISFVDVGAAIGDTALLLHANCPGMLGECICIDGDPEFFAYLQNNVRTLANTRCIRTLLSGSPGEERSLVRTHGGTASAQGDTFSKAETLDAVLSRICTSPVDVLKIDVDGFDGQVLAGARTLLSNQHPAVVFEWHPKLCAQTGNDPMLPFSVLCDAGYQHLLWFTKYGPFSHFGSVNHRDEHVRLERYCRETATDADCHFDVVALAESSPVSEQAVADLQFASRRRSPA